jgi:hypothetical protein
MFYQIVSVFVDLLIQFITNRFKLFSFLFLFMNSIKSKSYYSAAAKSVGAAKSITGSGAGGAGGNTRRGMLQIAGGEA